MKTRGNVIVFNTLGYICFTLTKTLSLVQLECLQLNLLRGFTAACFLNVLFCYNTRLI